jgi:hypothetical protein
MKQFLLYITLLLTVTACTKFQDTVDARDRESGIVNIIASGGDARTAKTEEEFILFAKIGEPVQSLKFYIGEIEITPLTTANVVDSVDDVFIDQKVGLPMVRYTFVVPRETKVGPNNVYFVINGRTRPPMVLNVTKPDILFPGKITVYPYLKGAANSNYLIDGPVNTASIAHMENMTYDATTRSFYFTDWYYEDPNQNGSPWYSVIRKIKDSVITTIAGGGNNADAINGKAYKVGTITAMCPGPGGALYFATQDLDYPLNPGSASGATRIRIMKIDPINGILTHIAGGKIRNGNAWTGIKDGKDSALMTRITSMAFDKNGNLYFIDDVALLRKVAPDGAVTTILGQYEHFSYENADPDTGEPVMETIYTTVREHTDGIGKEVLFGQAIRLAVAGNGKIYVQEEPYNEWQTSIREVNIDTREVSTVIGQMTGIRTFMSSGTFKEVELGDVMSFDVDFDGNIVFSTLPVFRNWKSIYKMDVQSETVALLAGTDDCAANPDQPLPGTSACFNDVNRIVFDQFGNLYVSGIASMRKITIEK